MATYITVNGAHCLETILNMGYTYQVCIVSAKVKRVEVTT